MTTQRSGPPDYRGELLYRRYRLEVLEDSLLDEGQDWVQWSTYVSSAKALDRQAKLVDKGYSVRVVDRDTGEIVDDVTEVSRMCEHCDEVHPGPWNGVCLL